MNVIFKKDSKVWPNAGSMDIFKATDKALHWRLGSKNNPDIFESFIIDSKFLSNLKHGIESLQAGEAVVDFKVYARGEFIRVRLMREDSGWELRFIKSKSVKSKQMHFLFDMRELVKLVSELLMMIEVEKGKRLVTHKCSDCGRIKISDQVEDASYIRCKMCRKARRKNVEKRLMVANTV